MLRTGSNRNSAKHYRGTHRAYNSGRGSKLCGGKCCDSDKEKWDKAFRWAFTEDEDQGPSGCNTQGSSQGVLIPIPHIVKASAISVLVPEESQTHFLTTATFPRGKSD